MRIAESVGSRTVIVVGALGLVGALVATLAEPAPVARVRQLRPMRACAPHKAPPVAPVASPARSHSDQVRAVQHEVTRCFEGGVDATLAFYTLRDGSVRDVVLEGNLGPRPEPLRACVTAVVGSFVFPPSESDLRVEILVGTQP